MKALQNVWNSFNYNPNKIKKMRKKTEYIKSFFPWITYTIKARKARVSKSKRDTEQRKRESLKLNGVIVMIFFFTKAVMSSKEWEEKKLKQNKNE